MKLSASRERVRQDVTRKLTGISSAVQKLSTSAITFSRLLQELPLSALFDQQRRLHPLLHQDRSTMCSHETRLLPSVEALREGKY